MPVKLAGSAHLKQDSPEWAAVICILEKLCWIWVQRFWAQRECGCHCVHVPSAQHKGRVGIEEVVRIVSEHLPTTSALSCQSLLLDVHFKSILVLPLHSFVPLLVALYINFCEIAGGMVTLDQNQLRSVCHIMFVQQFYLTFSMKCVHFLCVRRNK